MEKILLLMFLTFAALFACSPILRASVKDALGTGLERLAFSMGALAYFDDPDFETKVLGGVKKITEDQEAQSKQLTELEKQNKTLTDNFGNLQTETKQAFEDLTKCKEAANDIARTEIALKKVQSELRRERSAAWGNPMQRVLASEENRVRLNAELCRLAASKGEVYRADFMASAEVKGLQSDGSLGTTFIDDDLAQEIYSVLESYGAWASLGVRSVGTKTTNYPIKTARPVAKFIRKLAGRKLAADANKAATKAAITPELAGCLVLAEMELLDDAEVDLSADILGDIVEAVNLLMDHCAFVGDGEDDADNAEFEGIFTSGTAAVAADGGVSVADMTYADFLAATLAVDSVVLNRSPRWWMHQQQLARCLGVKDANGRPIFLTAMEAPSAGAIGTVMGYPVTAVAAAPNVDGVSKKIAAFGDPQSYIVAVRKAITLAQSDDFAFDEVSRAFRATARFGCGFRKASAISVLTTAAE